MANYCEMCGAPLAPGSKYCTSCGTPVPESGAAAAQAVPAEERGRVRTPRTIAELQAFCERHELPLAKMRFFIGLDYPGAKAFGIYQDADGQFVVYKNKADGSRAVRYRGPDEAYAVSELFEKLKSEATVQRAHAMSKRRGGYTASEANGRNPYNDPDRSVSRPRSKRRANALLIGLLAAAAAITIGRTAARLHSQIRPGYYSYGGQTYYSQQNDWYGYDDTLNDWYPIVVDDELQQHAGDYYASYSYDSDYGVADFADSSYYDSSDYDSGDSDSSSDSSWDWDWDDDDDWDSGDDWDWDSDWDSGYSDWDSDW